MLILSAGVWLEGVGGAKGLFVSRSVPVKERMMGSQFVQGDWRMRMFR